MILSEIVITTCRRTVWRGEGEFLSAIVRFYYKIENRSNWVHFRCSTSHRGIVRVGGQNPLEYHKKLSSIPKFKNEVFYSITLHLFQRDLHPKKILGSRDPFSLSFLENFMTSKDPHSKISCLEERIGGCAIEIF